MSKEKVGILAIKRLQRRSFQGESAANTYPTYRGIKAYNLELPTFENDTAVTHIANCINKGGTPSVLDIGCGQGVFLAELARDFDPRIKLYGLSAFDYRESLSEELQQYSSSIDYRIGDAHLLRKVFSDVKFDFIVSDHTFEWLTDPLRVLKRAYQSLNENGLMFIQDFGLELTQNEQDRLSTYWNNRGIKSIFQGGDPKLPHLKDKYDLVLQRSQSSRLPIPVKYSMSNDYSLGYLLTI